jgi:hypothetical protein
MAGGWSGVLQKATVSPVDSLTFEKLGRFIGGRAKVIKPAGTLDDGYY